MVNKERHLPSKVSEPHVGEHVEREALFSYLDDYVGRRVVWVAAPGGAGKTTLVGSYLASRAIETLWYEVDCRDTDPANIFHYLGLLACKAKLPSLTPEYQGSLPLFSASYFEQLFATLDKPFALVFDNLQEAPDEAALYTVLAMAARQLPAHGKIICISRNSPHRSFAEFQTKKQLLLIDESMMRLELEEIRQLARLISNNELNDESVERLYDKTRGWAAGLVLLIDDPELLASGVGHSGDGYNVIFDYFSSEFESKWNDELKQFLFNTALLPRMTRATATAMVGGVNVSAIIDSLMRRNYFISRYHGEVSGYQYHPLFQEFLLRKLVEVVPEDEVRALRDKAARLMLDEGYISEAIEIFAGNQQWDDVIQTILANAQTFAKKGRTVTIDGWLSHIPDQVIEAEPWLCYWKGICVLQSSPAKAISYAQASFDIFCKVGEKLGIALSWSLLIETMLVSWNDLSDYQSIFDKYDKFVGNDFIYPTPSDEASVLASGLGVAVFCGINEAVYDKWRKRAVDVLPKIDSINSKIILAIKLLAATIMLPGCGRDCSGVIDVVNKDMGNNADITHYNHLWWCCVLSSYYIFSGSYIDATKTLTKAFAISKQSGINVFDGFASAIFSLSAVVYGDCERAREWQMKNELMTLSNDSFSVSLMHMIRSLVVLECGGHGCAISEAGKAVFLSSGSGYNIQSVVNHIILASAYIGSGDYRKAEDAFSKINTINKKFNSRNILFISSCLKSWMLLLQGENETSLELFSYALDNVLIETDLLAIHGWRPSVMSRLCWEALNAESKVDKVSRLISRYHLPHPSSEKKLPNWPWQCKITTLGGFSVEVNGETVPAKKLKSKPWDILKALVVMGGRKVPIDEIADMLWPESDGDTASSAFSTNLQRLRVLLGNDDFLIVKDRTISINDVLVFVDLDLFESDEYPLHERMSVYSGEFLEGVKFDWVDEKREALTRQHEEFRHTELDKKKGSGSV